MSGSATATLLEYKMFVNILSCTVGWFDFEEKKRYIFHAVKIDEDPNSKISSLIVCSFITSCRN